MRERPVYLFNEWDTGKVLAARQDQLFEFIDAMTGEDLLAANADGLVLTLRERFQVAIPRLGDAITQDTQETRIDQSRNQNVHIRDRSRPFYVAGTAIAFHVPYTGDPDFFKCQPSTYSANPPFVSELRADELVIMFSGVDLSAQAVRAELEGRLSQIAAHLDTLRKDVGDYNDRLPELIRRKVDERRAKLLRDRALSADLGFPARRPDAPTTYTSPAVRRNIPAMRVPVTRSSSKAPSPPEPVIDMGEYEHILSVIQQMVAVIERSPSAFAGMSEEHLRQHFLVQLNGQYQGQATGETFNFQGKTDILVRVEGRNIFIAECKFWSGEKGLLEAIDQLLGYAAWRDTKLALLVFVRTKDFGAVIKKIGAAVQSHPSVKTRENYASETGYRFRLRHRDDPERELLLTVLAFHVPLDAKN